MKKEGFYWMNSEGQTLVLTVYLNLKLLKVVDNLRIFRKNKMPLVWHDFLRRCSSIDDLYKGKKQFTTHISLMVNTIIEVKYKI